MIKLYNQLLEKYPLRTKSFSSGIIFSIGDVLAQFIHSKDGFSWKRNANFFMLGLGYFGPVLHAWYSKLLPPIQVALFSKSSKLVKVLGSLCIDQLVFAPFLICGFFMANQTVIDRKFSLQKGVSTCREKVFGTLIEGWKIWPTATFINLWFVPVSYQVLFVNMVSLVWNIILSTIASK